MTYKYDFLVLGSGIAGLIYALEVSKYGRVALVTKRSLFDCNTDYAQGGIAAVLDAKDSFDEHIEDTYQAGADLGKKSVIGQIIKQGPKLIQYLMDLGTDFTRIDDTYDRRLENLSLSMEGGHTHRRVAYAADSTGHQIMQALIAKGKDDPALDIYENRIAVDLITQHHVFMMKVLYLGYPVGAHTCWIHPQTRWMSSLPEKPCLPLAGAARIYAHNTNPISPPAMAWPWRGSLAGVLPIWNLCSSTHSLLEC
jgi:L-aspartate oxidase